MSLGSCSSFGTPYDFPSVYDIITNKEMIRLGIAFKDATILSSLGQQHISLNAKDDNRRFVMKICRECINQTISHPDVCKIFNENGIDYDNAINFYNENRNTPSLNQRDNDVYDPFKCSEEKN